MPFPRCGVVIAGDWCHNSPELGSIFCIEHDPDTKEIPALTALYKCRVECRTCDWGWEHPSRYTKETVLTARPVLEQNARVHIKGSPGHRVVLPSPQRVEAAQQYICGDCGTAFPALPSAQAAQDRLCSKCWPKHYGNR